jgi:hypothetical protein
MKSSSGCGHTSKAINRRKRRPLEVANCQKRIPI